MKDTLDVHTHTLASGHAYSTLRENITAAKNLGLELVNSLEFPSTRRVCLAAVTIFIF